MLKRNEGVHLSRISRNKKKPIKVNDHFVTMCDELLEFTEINRIVLNCVNLTFFFVPFLFDYFHPVCSLLFVSFADVDCEDIKVFAFADVVESFLKQRTMDTNKYSTDCFYCIYHVFLYCSNEKECRNKSKSIKTEC